MNKSSIPGHQSINGDAPVLYTGYEGSSPSGGSCLECGKEIRNPKFCNRSCAAKFNNKKYPKRIAAPESRYHPQNLGKPCFRCGKPIKTSGSKFCSLACQGAIRREKVIMDWLADQDSGLTSIGTVKESIKEFYRWITNNKCQLCGWSINNEYTGKVPLVMDHIDGNFLFNRPENLRLICCNCDSLQATYKAANVGGGRKWRRSP